MLRQVDGEPHEGQPADESQPFDPHTAGTSFVDDNERHRQAGLELVTSAACMKIAYLRIIAEPLSKLLRTIMHVGGKAWELEQRRKAVQLMQAGKPADRLYRATVACEMIVEEIFFKDVKDLLFSSSSWEAIHPSLRDLRTSSSVFAMLSRGGAMVHELLRAPTQNNPSKCSGP